MPAAGAMAKPPSPASRGAAVTPESRGAALSPRSCRPAVTPRSRGAALSLDLDPVRDALLRRIEPVAAAWAAQDAELDAEITALERAGVFTVPAAEEWPGPAVDPDSAPPDGLQAWLADLPGPLLEEYLAATAEAAPEVPRAGLGGRVTREGAAFAADGVADLLRPGPALAGLAEGARAAGLSRLTDDELAGVIRAGRRLSSWASALELAAVGDLMRRREGEEAAGHQHAAEHVDAEIAALLTLTGRGAGRVLDLAIALRRLPLTVQALAAGAIDLPRVAVIADEMTGLDDDHAAEVERHILVRAPGQTTSQVRALARRAVLATDPRAARKRQEQAQREARVERWDEHAGTAALAGRDLPPAAVIAADQHISALARGLRAAGLAGTADQLRAQVFLALLSGASAASLLPTDQHQPDPAAASGPGTAPATSATTGGPPGTRPGHLSHQASGPGAADHVDHGYWRPPRLLGYCRLARYAARGGHGQPDHAIEHVARLAGGAGRGNRVRPADRRRQPSPCYGYGRTPADPLVRDADRRGRPPCGPRLRPARTRPARTASQPPAGNAARPGAARPKTCTAEAHTRAHRTRDPRWPGMHPRRRREERHALPHGWRASP